MTARLCFVDTNILVYARDASEPAKQARAQAWMAVLWQTRQGRISFQVLHEYYVTVTMKLRPGLNVADARREARHLLAWDPLVHDRSVLEGAWTLQDRFHVSWWDALIVSAAQLSGCTMLLSEDMQDGGSFDALTVVNPFMHDPSSL